MLNATLKVIEGRYFQDIMDQPRAIAATLEWLRSQGRWNEVRSFLRHRQWRRVVLTGMGSSFHTFHPLSLLLLESSTPTTMMETSELIHYGLPILDKDTLLIVVSQSGGSAETLRLLDANQNASTLAVTNTADSRLAEEADLTLLLQAGPEFSVSCKTYVAGMLALQWFGQVFKGADEQRTLERLEVASPAVENYLQQWRTYTQEIAGLLNGATHLFFAGRGDSLAAVGTGALITKESTQLHAEGMSSAALRHGAMEMLTPQMPTFVFAGDTRTGDLNRRLIRELAARGIRCEEIGIEARLAALRLPVGDALVRPIYEILPIEMITLAVAGLAGREAGVFKHAQKITATE